MHTRVLDGMRKIESDHKSWRRSEEFDFSDSDTQYFFSSCLVVCLYDSGNFE